MALTVTQEQIREVLIWFLQLTEAQKLDVMRLYQIQLPDQNHLAQDSHSEETGGFKPFASVFPGSIRDNRPDFMRRKPEGSSNDKE